MGTNTPCAPRAWNVLLVLLLTSYAQARAEPIDLWMTFDQQRLDPDTACDGEVVAKGCRLLSLTPVLFEYGDEAGDTNWKFSIQGTQKTPGKRKVTNVMRRDKGAVIAVEGSGSVKLRTALGEAKLGMDEVSWEEETRLLDGKVAVQTVPHARQLSTPATQDEFPGIACDRRGRVWVAWQSWDEKADSILVARCEDGKWSSPSTISLRTTDAFRVRLTDDGQGGVWVAWSEQRDGNWDIWARRLPMKASDAPLRLTTAPGADLNHELVLSKSGEVWLAWQSERDGQYDIFMAKLTPAGLTDTVQITDHPANDWEPSLATAQDGTVFVAWDTYRNGSYDIYLKRYANGRLSDAIPVACTPAYEAHPRVACDPQGRPWVVWDNGGANWGKHGPPPPRIHHHRHVEICCIDKGKKLVPKTPIKECLTPEIRGLWELPQIVFGTGGRPVVLFRNLTPIQRWNVRWKRRERQSRGIWAYFATTYDGESWTRPMLLAGTHGRNDQRPAIASDRDERVWVACAGDGRSRTRAEIPVNNNVFAYTFPSMSPPENPPALEPAPQAPSPVDLTEPTRNLHRVTVAGQQYYLCYGDTHRHTDISRCGMCADGSLLDTYRYALDAVHLDFLGISDHDQDILKHRYDHEQRALQGYMWWRSEKFCDLFLVPPSFLTLYGYEHGGSLKARGGHKNVMYAERGNPCLEQDAPADLFKALEGKYAVAIPHQLADGGSATDWDQWNSEFETVAEIFQARGSYEFLGCPRPARIQTRGYHYWEALAKGVKTGVIASSDHGLTHSAYACVYVKDRTRRAIIEGMKARRTFGATDTIVLDFRIGDHFMGEEAVIDGPAKMSAVVIGTAELARVDVVRDNQFIYTYNPEGPSHELSFTDVSLKPGQRAYYYLRCVQQNKELAWSSPIWVERK